MSAKRSRCSSPPPQSVVSPITSLFRRIIGNARRSSMSETNLYTTIVPPMMKALGALSKILDKAAAYAESKKTSKRTFEEALINDRLVFDQFPFIAQVRIACDNAKGGAARLAEVEIPAFEDNEKTVAELKARI